MPVFDYVALDAAGRRAKGRLEARSETELAAALRKDGVYLAEARSERREAASAPDRPLPAYVLSDLTERLEILVKAGVPLVDSLRQISEETAHPAAAAVLAALAESAAEGKPFSEGLQAFPRVFDASYRAVVTAGETSGALDEVLATLSTKLIQKAEARKNLKASLMQPAILVVALVGLFLLIVLVLVPKFSGIFAKAGVQPPSSTQAVLNVNDFLQAHWATLLAVLAAGVAAFRIGFRRRGFRAAVQSALYALPLSGKLIVLTEARMFVHVVGLLNKYGVNFTRSLEIARDAASTERMKGAIERVLHDVKSGGGFAESVKATGAFPPLVVQMVFVGQKTGELDDALGRVETYLDREIPRMIAAFLGGLGPAITLASGVAVGFAVFSVIQPLFAVMKAMKG